MPKELSIVEKALKAMEDVHNLKKAAIDELLAERSAIDEKLAVLGHTTARVAPKTPRSETKQRQKDPNAPCPVCNFVTVPPHDARKHRGQGDDKKPFTAKELEGFNLTKA